MQDAARSAVDLVWNTYNNTVGNGSKGALEMLRHQPSGIDHDMRRRGEGEKFTGIRPPPGRPHSA